MEYSIDTVSVRQVEDVLNSRVSAGWEVVAVTALTGGDGLILVVYKRSK